MSFTPGKQGRDNSDTVNYGKQKVMMDISRRVKRIEFSERSQRNFSVPEDAVRLDVGDPIFPTPGHIQEAAVRAIRDNLTHYGDACGNRGLRDAICHGLHRDYGAELTPENILVTTGGIEAIHIVSATYLDPGDEALVLDPDYSAYADSIKLFSATPVYVPLGGDLRPVPEALEERITPRSKIIFLSNPSNPAGTVLTEGELKSIAEIADRHNLLLVVDEAYHKIVYDGIEHFSLCQVEAIRERAILVNTFSKTYAMTGWRVGFVAAHEEVVKRLLLFHEAFVTCVSTPFQKACMAAILGPQDCIRKMVDAYDCRRKLVESRLTDIQGLSLRPSDGTFYSFPSFDLNKSSLEMSAYLAQNGVVVRSGSEFGQNGEGHFRIAFTKSEEELNIGLLRIKAALEALGADSPGQPRPKI